MRTQPATVTLTAVLVALLPACGQRPSAQPPSSGSALQGTIDARPFTARVGFAQLRSDGDIDIFFYERETTARERCADASSAFDLDDAERLVWVQMPWPIPGGAEGRPYEVSTVSDWGVFLHVQRGHGSTSTRATGTMTVERAQPSEGILHMDVATENDTDLHGSVRGTMAFSICPR